MKLGFTLAVFFIMGACRLFGQSSEAVNKKIITAQPSQSAGVPMYLVYRHFLAWVDALDKQASAKGTSDPYAFARQFASGAGLSNLDLDLLRGEAGATVAAIKQQDDKAAPAIAAYRARAKALVSSGQQLPPPPSELHILQEERTALIVQHYSRLRDVLGPESSRRLDGYLSREFAPHIKMQPIAEPK